MNQKTTPEVVASSEGLGPAWRLRAWIGERMQGGCRVLSQGSACQCPLCDLDRLRDALLASQTWLYGHENCEGQSERRRLNAEVLGPNAELTGGTSG